MAAVRKDRNMPLLRSLRIFWGMFYKYAAPTALVLQMSARQIPARGFSRGRRTRLRLRCVNPVAADVSPLIIPAGGV